MTYQTKTDRARGRADRLRREATNCLSIAIRERRADDAAQLIDEAIRLAKRSDELAAGWPNEVL